MRLLAPALYTSMQPARHNLAGMSGFHRAETLAQHNLAGGLQVKDRVQAAGPARISKAQTGFRTGLGHPAQQDLAGGLDSGYWPIRTLPRGQVVRSTWPSRISCGATRSAYVATVR